MNTLFMPKSSIFTTIKTQHKLLPMEFYSLAFFNDGDDSEWAIGLSFDVNGWLWGKSVDLSIFEITCLINSSE